MKYEILEHWGGCTVSKQARGERFPVYVGGVYRGRVSWVSDYAHARKYSTRAARLVVAKLLGGAIK